MSADGTPSAPDLANLRIERPQTPAVGRRRRSWLLPAVAVILLAIPAAYAMRWFSDRRLPVVQTALAALVGANDPGVVLTASGYVVTRHKYITIGTKVLGQIVAEPIEEGQRIRKGDLLAQIDDRDYGAQLRQAEAAREVAAANLRLTRSKAERARRLLGTAAISQDDYETTINAAEVANATLRSAAATVDYAAFMVAQCMIRSPINGVVLQKYREVGDTINYGGALQAGGGATDIAQLADTDDMRAEVDINEADIGKVALGSPANVVLDAYPTRRFDGRLVKIYPEADRQKGTVKVEVRIEEPDLQIIKAEMGVKVSFIEESPAAAGSPMITVPKSAVRSSGVQTFVWVVREGAVHRVSVTRGVDTETGVKINSGLQGGEELVTGTPVELREGQRVNQGH
jgi:RND family efflux transporter MFP subunit